jgi:hypothetical protein
LNVASLDEVEVGPIDTAVVARMQNVIACVCSVVSYPVQIAVGRVAGEGALAFTEIGAKD